MNFVPALVALLAISATGARASWVFGNDINEESCLTVTETVNQNGQFQVLSNALVAAGLDEMFNETKLQVTVFAPSDNAFNTALDKLNVTAEQVLGNQELLQEILKAHVVPGLVWLDSFSLNTMAENERVNIQPYAVLGYTNNVPVRVTTPPSSACRSLIYPIDSVMLPAKAIQALT